MYDLENPGEGKDIIFTILFILSTVPSYCSMIKKKNIFAFCLKYLL